MELRELQELLAPHGFHTEERDGEIHVVGNNGQIDVIWRDGEFYALNGESLINVLNKIIATERELAAKAGIENWP